MILKQEGKILIRTIEYRDKDEIISMFQKESFGFLGILADEKPSILTEISIIDDVLSKESLIEEYIILEVEGIIISYACIFQDDIDKVHIGSLVTKEEYRNCGYGSCLLNFIKEYANQNNLIIRTESITCGSLLQKHGFELGQRKTDYIYSPKDNKFKTQYPSLFDYEKNIKLEEEKEREDLEAFSKTLDMLKEFGWF